MSLIRRFLTACRNLVYRDRIDRDLDSELHSVFTLLVDQHLQAGMRPDEARRAAMLALGGVESVKEQVRDVRAGILLDTFLQDCRYAARSLRRTPGFTLAAVTMLALGIGANTAMFTLLDAVMFKPLAVRAPHELITLYETAPDATPDASGGTGRYLRFSFPRFQRLEQALGSHGSLAVVTPSTGLLARRSASAPPMRVQAQLVSGGYFSLLGVSAARGRVLMPDDVRIDRMAAAVISDGFRRTWFEPAQDPIGQTIVLNDVTVTIVGVTPRGFSGLWSDEAPEVWLPVTLRAALGSQSNTSRYGPLDPNRSWLEQDTIAWLTIVGRIPRAERTQAAALMQVANQQGLIALTDTFANAKDRPGMLAHRLVVEPFAQGFSHVRSGVSDALVVMMAMVAIVLLVTCANVANLLLTRAAGRARDVSIRLALGATRGRLIRQSLTESVMLAALGGAAGWFVGQQASALLARQVLGSATGGDLPPAFSPDARVLAMTAGLSLLTALLFGLAPALRALRMGAATHVSNQRQAIGASAMKGMRPLVAAQLALSVVVVTAAALLGRTLVKFMQVDAGFAADRIVTVSFDAAATGSSRAQSIAIGQRLVSAIERVPGVTSATLAVCGLVAGCSYTNEYRFENGAAGVLLNSNWIGARYFTTVGIPLIAGREFSDRDTAESPRVCIISESIARRHFNGQNPIGKRLAMNVGANEPPNTEIVGVVRDVRSVTLREPPIAMVYFPIAQPPASPIRTFPNNIDVRFAPNAALAMSTVRDAVRQEEPAVLLDAVAPMSQRLARNVAREWIVAYVVTGFAILALSLAALGLYSVLSYAVAGRTQEIGVRMALGARASDVAGLVVRSAMTMVVVGVIVGAFAALAAARLLKRLLFDVSVLDPATGALVLVTLAAVTIAAAYIPAVRAARVDPIAALRSE